MEAFQKYRRSRFSKTNHWGGQLITEVTGRYPLFAAFLLKVTELGWFSLYRKDFYWF